MELRVGGSGRCGIPNVEAALIKKLQCIAITHSHGVNATSLMILQYSWSNIPSVLHGYEDGATWCMCMLHMGARAFRMDGMPDAPELRLVSFLSFVLCFEIHYHLL